MPDMRELLRALNPLATKKRLDPEDAEFAAELAVSYEGNAEAWRPTSRVSELRGDRHVHALKRDIDYSASQED